MTERHQTRLVLHGAVALLAGLLAGIPMAFAITGDWGDQVVRAWRVAHVGLVAGGVMLVAIAPALALVSLDTGAMAWLVRSLLLAVYAAVVALPLGAAAGVRGLAPDSSVANLVVFACNAVLGVGSLAGTLLLLGGATRRLREGAVLGPTGRHPSRGSANARRGARSYDDSLGAPG